MLMLFRGESKKAIDRFAREKILTDNNISLMMLTLWRINEYT